MKKQRLDRLVFERGLAESREARQNQIMAGLCLWDGRGWTNRVRPSHRTA
jgi:predicted rRNA methylase YqxC with S4 and FtsJ domains